MVNFHESKFGAPAKRIITDAYEGRIAKPGSVVGQAAVISPRMVRVKPRTCFGRRGFKRDARRPPSEQVCSVGTGKSANRCAKAIAHRRRLTVERQWSLTWVSMKSATVSASAGNHLQDLAPHQSMKQRKSAAYPFTCAGNTRHPPCATTRRDRLQYRLLVA